MQNVGLVPRLVILALLVGGVARAQTGPGRPLAPRVGKHCLEEPRRKLVLDQFLAGSINQLGAEHQLQLSLCVPLIHSARPLLAYTTFEIGVMNYLSPVYDYQGVFAALTPLSILVLRAEVAALAVWPLSAFPAAGYFPLGSYSEDFSPNNLTADKAGSAFGVSAALSATLRGKINLGARAALLFVGSVIGDYHRVGDGAYYYNSRRDVLVAQSDWIVKFTGLLLAEVALNERLLLRVGASDDLVHVPASGYLGNLTAGLLAVQYRPARGRVRMVQPFTRIGGYTHHAFRRDVYAGINAVLGIALSYELYAEGGTAGGAGAPP